MHGLEMRPSIVMQNNNNKFKSMLQICGNVKQTGKIFLKMLTVIISG